MFSNFSPSSAPCCPARCCFGSHRRAATACDAPSRRLGQRLVCGDGPMVARSGWVSRTAVAVGHTVVAGAAAERRSRWYCSRTPSPADSQIWSVALAARSAASWGLTSLVLLMVVPGSGAANFTRVRVSGAVVSAGLAILAGSAGSATGACSHLPRSSSRPCWPAPHCRARSILPPGRSPRWYRCSVCLPSGRCSGIAASHCAPSRRRPMCWHRRWSANRAAIR
jgi:hypothetical protein